MLIALASRTLASYPLGGGVWAWMLQYPMGLRALGHNIFWLELMKSSGDRAHDARLRERFPRANPSLRTGGTCRRIGV